jgi:multimeric flavodoxin WrbA
MARILGILGSARKDGYTLQVLDALLQAAQQEGVEVEVVHLLDYAFGSCRSCYECIRRPGHRCIQKDDMGLEGAGKLWQKVQSAQAMVWAAPVHFWTADALLHLFVERLYPFLWSGELKGMPVATLAVASNQGFQHHAQEMLCQWAFALGASYTGGAAVHAAYLQEGLAEAKVLGQRLARAALQDERGGRRALSDEELWLAYQGAPWAVYPHYVANLTMNTGRAEFSVIRRALAHRTFHKEEAIALLGQAHEAFSACLQHRQLGEERQALRMLVKASALWTHATWKEFLEEDLIRVPPPQAYRPLESGEVHE